MHSIKIMGILNATPNSFFTHSRTTLDTALRHAEKLIQEGAALLDIGGESTAPGAEPVPVQQELDRVIPIIEAIKNHFDIPISIDTQKPEVMQAAVHAGASLINDVNALQAPGALAMAATLQVPVCLMHKQGTPQTMQQAPTYQNVVAEVKAFLQERMQAALAAGIGYNQLIIDPGFGFGKTLAHNLQLLNALAELTTLGVPVLVGMSRKTFVGAVLGVPVEERLYGSLAVAVMAALQGAQIIRTHDVGPTVQAIRMVEAVRRLGEGN